jgi:hypothetical protein
MTIGELRSLIDNFEDDQDLIINVKFPNVDGWTVGTGDIGYDVDENYGTLSLEISVYLADFDYTDVWKKLKDVVNDASASRL